MRKGRTIPLQMIGVIEPRQQMWEQIRCLRSFKLPELVGQMKGGIYKSTVHTYVKSLLAAGILSMDENKIYTLVQDRGVEAPRVKRDGSEVTTGRAQENMWRTLRQLGRSVSVTEMVTFASTETNPISESFALDYLKNLAKAGYLVRDKHRYLLLPDKNTGPRPPMIRRSMQIVDQNLGQIMWSKTND